MKKLLYILFLFPFLSHGQSGLYVHVDTIFSFDPLTGIYTQITKLVPTQSGQSGKVLSTNGSAYLWTNVQSTITTGTTAQYFKGDLSLATFPTTTAGFSNSTDKNFVTDAQSTVIGNTSGTNSGDNAVNSLYSGLVTNATHTGDATGATALTVVKINGTSLAGLSSGILKNTTGTGVPSIAAQSDITGLLGAGSITNTMIANGAVANLSGTNTGDQTTVSGNAGSATILATGRTIGITGDVTYTSPTFNGSGNVTSTATVNSVTAKLTSYNAISTVGNGVASEVATIDATAQAANISIATLYAVPASGAGMYRISIYITVTQAATTSSTMPSTAITYVDGNSGSNTHSTTTTATSAGNSVTTTFAQTTYILYAKASTNIQYATAGYVSSGGTALNYGLRIKVEAL